MNALRPGLPSVKNPSLAATPIDDEPEGTECAAARDVVQSVNVSHFDKIVGKGHPATARWMQQRENEKLQGLLSGRDSLKDLMGPSRQIERIFQQVTQVAGSSVTVLIQGETGTGKELVARAIHQLSGRRRGPFIALDCGAIPETLIESELFGHEKGAFTGADQRKIGYFPLAQGGSLFLDEISNLPLLTQAKLLRALQERVVHPLGGPHAVPVDVRIITTANVLLEHEARGGRFRQDLYYRLNEFTITLPALRERAEDILYLANRFLAEACLEFKRPISKISEEAAQLLLQYHWPGNVRQLRSVVRQAVLLSQNGIAAEHLLGVGAERFVPSPVADSTVAPTGRTLRQIAAAAAALAERGAISQALQAAGGNKSAVARLLEVDYKTLLIKLKRYGICGREFETG
jgi:transcriptional regulator with PAS, ATPase and Fis domain